MIWVGPKNFRGGPTKLKGLLGMVFVATFVGYVQGVFIEVGNNWF